MSNLTNNNAGPPSTKFRLDKHNGKLFGVCSGLANWSGVDALVWRLGFVVCTLLGIGFPILIYLAIALIAD
ncbi:recombination protein F [Erythrobacter sp. NAP1]|uniref:PspC domain-containing protein n=1 Tax=unclassified Erythrobacter TaxID=2633097 RepID=UPI00006851E4|nr:MULTISPECIES: PspC domain-containing protein [unclassified Erythrobacter]AWW75319.1 recombinase RecF [Erythrobacter sp. KY5]EAQ27598.1 recombination protein F [Erythrobacter sp. NAP1]